LQTVCVCRFLIFFFFVFLFFFIRKRRKAGPLIRQTKTGTEKERGCVPHVIGFEAMRGDSPPRHASHRTEVISALDGKRSATPNNKRTSAILETQKSASPPKHAPQFEDTGQQGARRWGAAHHRRGERGKGCWAAKRGVSRCWAVAAAANKLPPKGSSQNKKNCSRRRKIGGKKIDRGFGLKWF